MTDRFRRYTSTLAVLPALVATLVATGCRPEQASRPQQVSIRLAWVPDMAEAGVFVAKQNGHFARRGLQVDIQPGGFGLDPLKLVAAGSNEFGVAGAGNLLLAREQGLPVVAIAAEFQSTPVGFITRAGSGIRNFSEFRGKRVGIQTGADTDVLYRALLTRSGLGQGDVREIPIQYDVTPFLSGAIDVLPGYVTNQPITLRGQGVAIEVLDARSLGAHYYGNVFFTTERMIRENPEVVRRFVEAVQAGWADALSNKQSAVHAVAAATQDFKPAELNVIYDAVTPFIRPPGTAAEPLLGMRRERWESTYQILRDAGLSKTPRPVDEAFTTNFIPRRQ